jgi:hypothetical protein
MGVINLYKGYAEREIFNFNGRIRDNLNLDWENVKIFKNEKELTPDYEVQENDVITIQVYHGITITAAAIILGVVSIGVAVGVGIYAYKQAQKARREMEEALKRIGKSNKQPDVSSIPMLADAKNERADGKNAPIILGRHLFTPYFLSEPYMRPSGNDGEDLYWYGTFIAGQNGLCLEKIKNGSTDLVTFLPFENTPQYGFKYFDIPADNPKKPPPFYTPENFAIIAQEGHGFDDPALSPFEQKHRELFTRFEEKWADSLDSSVEIGRLKKENARRVNASGFLDEDGLYIEDEGDDPIIRPTSRFPLRAEIELLVDGLHGWDSENGVETPANVGITLEWSTSDSGGWNPIPIDFSGTERVINRGTPLSEVFSIFTGISVSSITPLGFSKTIYKNGKYGNRDFTRIEITGIRTITNLWEIHIIFNTSGGQVNLTDRFGLGASLPENIYIYSGSALLTRASSKQMRFLAEVNFPSSVYSKEGNPVFIRAVRTTRMYYGGYRDRVYLSALRTKQYNPNTSNGTQLTAAKNLNERLVGKVCRIGIKIKVNQNTQEFLDRFNIIASMTARTWNGEWSVEKTKTSNPAAVLLELMTGLIHDPSKYADEELDLNSFGRLYEYCIDREVKLEGEGIRKFNLECNGVLTSGTRKLDAINSILATCDGGLYINEFGRFEVYYDHTQSAPVGLLNPQRTVKMSYQKSMGRKADGYTVEFIDQEAGWQTSAHRILRPNPPDIESWNYTYSPVKLDFTTSYNQAMWHARRMMAKEIHRPGEAKITVGKEGRRYKPGSLIKVQHERFKIGLGSGEVVSLITSGKMVTGLYLMESFDIAADRDYYIDYYVVDETRNHVVTKQIQSAGGYTNVLMFTVPIPKDSVDVPVMENILSVMHGEKTGTPRIYEAKRYLVSELSENALGYDLTLVPYSDVVYQTTTIDEIPDYKSSIINSPPRLYGDAQRELNDLRIENAINQLNPENISNTIVNETTIVIPQKAPRYRGMTTTADHENTGIIDGNKMNRGDWIAYTGITEGVWEYGYCYEWSGVEWGRLEVDSANMGKYMAALQDLTAGAPNGYFSTLFCKTLVTVDAFIQNLYMQNGVMTNGGVLQSENFNPSTYEGWAIFSDGRAFFNRCAIDADSFTVNGLGYLPLHFVYTQYPRQLSPQGTFSGSWEEITKEYAGLFFRAAGGNAAPFGQDQKQSYGISGMGSVHTNNSGVYTAFAPPISFNDNHPVNTAVRIWKKIAN